MAVVVKSFVFTSDAEGLSDAANTASITFAHESADGSPSNGSVKFTSAGNVNATEYARRASTGQTWQTWGVPANAVVTSIQVTAWQRKVASFSIGDSLSIKARVIDSNGVSLHGADLFSENFTAPIGWGAGGAGNSRGVDSGKQASSTDVRLELECAMNDGGLGNAFDLRLDTIDLTITYDETAPPTTTGFELFEASTGLQKYIPPIHSCSFELGERGGCLSGDAELLCAWEDLDLDGTEFLDVTLFGERIYRGWVLIPARNLDSPETASLSLQGFREKLNRLQVRWKLAYGGDGADLATIAGDLITDFVVEAGWTITQDMDAVGITLNEFDARGMSVAQALDKLCDYASGTAIWGYTPGFTDTTPTHTIYFRPKPTTTGKYYVIGKDVTGFSYPPDTGSVINVVNLTGGPVKQPNLVYNGSFEEVAPASETVANLLLDYSFEDGDAAWTLTGTRKYTGLDATARGVPKSGKYWLEIDQNTESGIQTVKVPYTVIYTGSCWVRQETAGTGREVKLTLEGLDSGSSVVVSANTGFVVADDEWEKISVDLDTTGSSTVERIRFTVETNGGTANQDGVLVDDCALIEKNGEGQIGWRRIVAGDANASTFNWAFKAKDIPAWTNPERFPHGGYVVYLEPTGIALSSDYVEIRNTKDKRIEVPPNERITFLVAVGGGPVTFTLGIIEYDSEGTIIGSAHESDSYTHTVNAAFYSFQETASTEGYGLTTSATTRFVEVFIRYRDTASDPMYIDKVFVCVGGQPEDISITSNADTNYWTGENFERRFRVDDTALTLDAAAETSITDYGERETDESNELVTNYDEAETFITEFFNAYAIPPIMARLVLGNLESADELLYPTDDKIQVQNLNDAPDALNPVRIGYQIRGDVISFNADLGSETPSFEALFNLARGRERGRVF